MSYLKNFVGKSTGISPAKIRCLHVKINSAILWYILVEVLQTHVIKFLYAQ